MTSIGERFSHAHRYDEHAVVQRQAAAQFDAWLATQTTSSPPTRIAELGCGTGFLTQHLHQRYPDAYIEASDIAPGMIERAHQRFHGVEKENPSRLSFTVADARHLFFTSHPDWVVSALCFQWFTDLQQVISHHLKQTRVLTFSVLLEGSFNTWRQAHHQAATSPALWPLPRWHDLDHLCRDFRLRRVVTHRVSLCQNYPDGLTFARALRLIGADTPRPQHRPGHLLPVLRQLAQGFSENYELAFVWMEH